MGKAKIPIRGDEKRHNQLGRGSDKKEKQPGRGSDIIEEQPGRGESEEAGVIQKRNSGKRASALKI